MVLLKLNEIIFYKELNTNLNVQDIVKEQKS